MSLLEVKDLRTYFYTQEGTVKAVDGTSYVVEEGETLHKGIGYAASALVAHRARRKTMFMWIPSIEPGGRLPRAPRVAPL